VRALLGVLVGLLAFGLLASARQEPDLAEILGRVSAYVDVYQARLAGIVSEEQYRQSVRRSGRTSSMTSRRLRSDLLLVRPSESGPWLQFRDVFEVDGKPVRDRDERLLKLFVQATGDPREQALAIAMEGARYNIGPLVRTINVPVLALAFLSEANQPRSRFSRAKPGNLKRFDGLADARDVWAVSFRETAPDTLVRGDRDADVPSQGRAWVDGSSGRVLATEHVTRSPQILTKVEVTYKPQSDLPVFVPTEMREQYQFRTYDVTITGTATYGHFRQFRVTTEEKPKPPGGPERGPVAP